MVKASALYIVIIIALVIGLLSAAIVATAYFYRQQYIEKLRYTQLQNNVFSGVNILLADKKYDNYENYTLSLFAQGKDTVALTKRNWGIFDLCISKAFIQQDTITKVFFVANTIDSAKWGALYIKDEDRSIGISGNTVITGKVFLPKAGLLKSYINGNGYTGSDKLVDGTIFESNKKLPELEMDRIRTLDSLYTPGAESDTSVLNADIVRTPFSRPARQFSLNKNEVIIKNKVFTGNIILRSDTNIIIDSTSRLDNIIVFARSIVVRSGFRGNCQLFARDSVRIEKNCTFQYPSCVGIVNLDPIKQVNGFPLKISIGENTMIFGSVFIYQKITSELIPMINIEKKAQISGLVYSPGFIKYNDEFKVCGSIFTRGFLIQKDNIFQENVLNNISISLPALSKYYLTSQLFPVSGKKKKVLQWLN